MNQSLGLGLGPHSLGLGLGLETLSLGLVLGLETQSLGLVDPSLDYITESSYTYRGQDVLRLNNWYNYIGKNELLRLMSMCDH